MNQGCLEKLPDLDFVKWIWTYPVRHRPGILKMLSDAELAGKRVIIAKSPRELSDRIEQIKNSG